MSTYSLYEQRSNRASYWKRFKKEDKNSNICRRISLCEEQNRRYSLLRKISLPEQGNNAQENNFATSKNNTNAKVRKNSMPGQDKNNVVLLYSLSDRINNNVRGLKKHRPVSEHFRRNTLPEETCNTQFRNSFISEMNNVDACRRHSQSSQSSATISDSPLDTGSQIFNFEKDLQSLIALPVGLAFLNGPKTKTKTKTKKFRIPKKPKEKNSLRRQKDQCESRKTSVASVSSITEVRTDLERSIETTGSPAPTPSLPIPRTVSPTPTPIPTLTPTAFSSTDHSDVEVKIEPREEKLDETVASLYSEDSSVAQKVESPNAKSCNNTFNYDECAAEDTDDHVGSLQNVLDEISLNIRRGREMREMVASPIYENIPYTNTDVQSEHDGRMSPLTSSVKLLDISADNNKRIRRNPSLSRRLTRKFISPHQNTGTLLQSAVADNDYETIQKILSSNCDINFLYPPGVSILHQACVLGDFLTVQLLVQKGADVRLKTWSNWSPTQLAAIYGHFDIAQLLLLAGANVEDVQDGVQLI